MNYDLNLILFLMEIQLAQQISMTKRQERNLKFIQMINEIPTLEPSIISNVEELVNSIKTNNDFNLTTIDAVAEKLRKMRCSYSLLALYLIYHVELDKHDERQLDYIQLEIFSDILHRILSIFYYIPTPGVQGIWTASITIDALCAGKILYNEIDFNKIQIELFTYCSKCYKTVHLPEAPLKFFDYKNKGYTEKYANKLSDKLILSQYVYPESFDDFYKFAQNTNIFSFIWKDSHNKDTFKPPITQYDTFLLDRSFNYLMSNWKNDYFSLIPYTFTIRNNVLLVMYYSIVRHFVYIIQIYHQVYNNKHCNENEFLELFQIPLEILIKIGKFIDFDTNKNFQEVIDMLSTTGNFINIEDIENLTKEMLKIYDYFSYKFNSLYLDYTKMKSSLVIQIPFDFSKTKNQLQRFANDMKDYYLNVKREMSPVKFTILKGFHLK
ncbi:uncharacterized protein LOC126907695 [Daktulosphaira vitifoliae]|uniref:uncharacterized protein LOC126907695 n=1 Tax=Daktulosphaira vitifoliae TaxID=58002 RepID=UPI0021A9BBCF|nr:uncharacterized protein LOC126907695 [Daktulosphaira vitifoliae]